MVGKVSATVILLRVALAGSKMLYRIAAGPPGSSPSRKRPRTARSQVESTRRQHNMTIEPFGPPRPTDYLANERTFLAYIRTSLSVMAFGFVISRFGLLLRLLPGGGSVRSTGASEWLGIAFAAFGCLLAVLGVWRFLSTTRDLDANRFKASATTNTIVGWATVLLGIAVVLSLVRLL